MLLRLCLGSRLLLLLLLLYLVRLPCEIHAREGPDRAGDGAHDRPHQRPGAESVAPAARR